MGVSERECLDGNVFKECLKKSVIKEVSLREWVSKLDETPSQHNLFIVNMTFACMWSWSAGVYRGER